MTPHRRKRIRMEGFDYATPGCYFVTITMPIRKAWFGSVANGVLTPNAAGLMVRSVWDQLPARFPGVMMDCVVVMPDHMHGIMMLGTDANVMELPTLSRVIGAFKSTTAVEYGRGVASDGWPPYQNHLWHRSFRDTIIRSDRALDERSQSVAMVREI